jgi:SulP family sulfate permease
VHQTNPYALAVGLGTILLLAGCRRVSRRLPAALIAIVAVTLMAGAAGWLHVSMGDNRVKIVRDIQEIVPSLDVFAVPAMLTQPNWLLWQELLGGALALAILGLVESTSIARGIATSSGQRLDFNREFAAQGAAKICGAFCHSFASSGSFTRSALCYQSGGRTRGAAALSAVFTAVIVLTLGTWANFVPQAALAGMLMVIAFTMIERDHLAMTWKSGQNSRIVLGGTFLATLTLPLEMAVFAGVILSVVILLRVTGRTDLTQLVHHPDYGFEEVPFNHAAPSPVAIINLEGDLYFAAAEDLDYELLQALRPETKVVVLRLKRLRAVGSSAMAMLEHFHELLDARGIELILCGVENDIKKVMTGSGLRRTIGEQNIFYADNRIFQSTELAIARAMSIVEMRRAASDKLAEAVQEETLTATNVSDVLQKRCLRFGDEHQLREAMWLISQFQERMRTDYPQTVFLQDRDGRLSAALSQALVLRDLAGAVPEEEAAAMDDRTLAVLLETRLYRPVSDIAPKDAVTLSPGAPLAEAFARAARHGFRPMPVCDEHGRIAGVFDEVAMLRGLTRFLEARHLEFRRPTGPTPPAP